MAPVLSAVISSPDAVTHWYNIASGAATVTYTATDAGGSGVTAPAAYVFGDGADQSLAAVTVFDVAGNESNAAGGYTGINQDRVAPVISAVMDRSPDPLTHWYNISTGAPVALFTASDDLSGLAASPTNHTFGQGYNQSWSETVTDVAGNSAIAGVSGINVDGTRPSVNGGGDQTVPEGSPVTLTGTFTDLDGFGPYTSLWHMESSSNGQVVSDASGDTLTFTPVDNGIYAFSYTVSDVAGNVGSDTVVVTATNVPPTATDMINSGPVTKASPVTVSLPGGWDVSEADMAAGLHYFFSTSESARDAATYDTAGTADSQQFTFSNSGSYTVFGRILDKDNGYTDYQTNVMVVLPGDANMDGTVNGADLTIVLSNYNDTVVNGHPVGWADGDFNGDGVVNGADLNIVLSNYNQSVAVSAAAVTLPPSFALSGPTAGRFTVGQSVPIQWAAANVEAGSTISLCLDQDTVWNNGNETWIEVNQVAAANGNGSYTWNTTGVKPGTYYVAGYLNTNGTLTYSHLTQSIVIAAPAPLVISTPTGPKASPQPIQRADLLAAVMREMGPAVGYAVNNLSSSPSTDAAVLDQVFATSNNDGSGKLSEL